MREYLELIHKLSTYKPIKLWRGILGKYRVHESLWHHSVNVAVISSKLFSMLVKDPELSKVVFLAGLLHDYEKYGKIPSLPRVEVDELCGITGLSRGFVECAMSIAMHVEAGVVYNPILISLPEKCRENYKLMSMCVQLADAIASLETVNDFERAFVIVDEEYWVKEHSWRRYLDSLKLLTNKYGVSFGSVSLTLDVNPHVRSKIIEAVVELLGKRGWTPLTLYHDGIAFAGVKVKGGVKLSEVVKAACSRIVGELYGEEITTSISIPEPPSEIVEIHSYITRKLENDKALSDEDVNNLYSKLSGTKRIKPQDKSRIAKSIILACEEYSKIKRKRLEELCKVTVKSRSTPLPLKGAYGRVLVSIGSLTDQLINAITREVSGVTGRYESTERSIAVSLILAKMIVDVYQDAEADVKERIRGKLRELGNAGIELAEVLGKCRSKNEFIHRAIPLIYSLIQEGVDWSKLLESVLCEAKASTILERKLHQMLTRLLPRYMYGSLIERDIEYRREPKRQIYCYYCGLPITLEESLGSWVRSRLFEGANFQVKFWMPHRTPLELLDNYGLNKTRVCPLCLSEIMLMCSRNLRPPYIHIVFYPTATIELLTYSAKLLDVYEELYTNLMIEIQKKPEERVNIADIVHRSIVTRDFDEKLRKAVSESIGDFMNLAYKVVDIISSGFGEVNLDSILSDPIEVYDIDIVKSVSIPSKFERLRSCEASKTISVALTPILAYISLLTGGQVVVSDTLSRPPVHYGVAVSLPYRIFFPAKFVNVEKAKEDSKRSIHRLLLDSLYVNITASKTARAANQKFRNEILRVYDAFAQAPLTFMKYLNVARRMYEYEKLRGGESLYNTRLIVSVGETLLRIFSGQVSMSLLNHVEEVVKFLNENHWLREVTDHKLTAPLMQAFEVLLSKVDVVGDSTAIELASARFADRIRDDVERLGYRFSDDKLAKAREAIKPLLKSIVDIYRRYKDSKIIRDLVNDIRVLVIVKRREFFAQKRKSKEVKT